MITLNVVCFKILYWARKMASQVKVLATGFGDLKSVPWSASSQKLSSDLHVEVAHHILTHPQLSKKK